MNSFISFPVRLIITVLLLSGCAVCPDFVRPDAPTEEEWIDSGVPQIKTEKAFLMLSFSRLSAVRQA